MTPLGVTGAAPASDPPSCGEGFFLNSQRSGSVVTAELRYADGFDAEQLCGEDCEIIWALRRISTSSDLPALRISLPQIWIEPSIARDKIV
ncbi:hypothetical protein B5P45_28420 [Phyllobacterium zundukense]|uniref:Uncharacterized protein n=1 Tax=Phyllobacterium zundukense TaxID=1867719 RepID=A0A2N9VPA3_9HYPH|nr:hypothetical protein BLM14_24400 [Phyllobacterium zundukense]PIO41321.1 hypothetical protein B5P45_28420 [Phyllobacterium zundukense]